MTIHTRITSYLRRRAALWERRRTERFIQNLPAEVQKDIGWPGSDNGRSSNQQASLSHWEHRW
ncbi:hypothetical protein [Nitratireductor thuwali]|uniref:DUF1127 domain-containing protein n=1 Tax=Nitratireductor thuwali TaxID=2267699 RepID=A0ABY5ME15_9HYPH|nr:hypothetical protein NTH_00482 [Nitratireductor thuwali]